MASPYIRGSPHVLINSISRGFNLFLSFVCIRTRDTRFEHTERSLKGASAEAQARTREPGSTRMRNSNANSVSVVVLLVTRKYLAASASAPLKSADERRKTRRDHQVMRGWWVRRVTRVVERVGTSPPPLSSLNSITCLPVLHGESVRARTRDTANCTLKFV